MIIFGLVLLIQTTLSAEMIRCRTADGTMVFTEDPSQVPDGCEPITTRGMSGGLNIMPAQGTPPEESNRPKIMPQLADPVPTATQKAAIQSDVTSWKNSAHVLVKEYNTALHRRRAESFMVDKQAAIREMEALRGQKTEMLADLDSSSLSREESRQIEAILAEIP
jgi:hypothetical protein